MPGPRTSQAILQRIQEIAAAPVTTYRGGQVAGRDMAPAVISPAVAEQIASTLQGAAGSQPIAPRQQWIPGVPSTPAELAAPIPANEQRVLDYWARAGRRARAEEIGRRPMAGFADRPSPVQLPLPFRR